LIIKATEKKTKHYKNKCFVCCIQP